MKSHLYQKRSHILFIWVTLLFLASAQSQKHIDIIPFQDSLQILSSTPRFYSLDLANPPKDLDLLISVLPEGRSCSAKLFISNTKEFPKNIKDADFSSVSTSGNVLLINHKDLAKRLYIGLDSGDSVCYSKIIVEWTKEMKMIANEEKVIANSNDLDVALSAIVRLEIPKGKDIERIVIHVDALKASMRELLSLEVFANQGASIPFKNNEENIARKGAWFEGNTMIISKDSKLFCTDCTYTLSLKFTGSSSISVQAQTFKTNMPISGTATLDAVQKRMKNTFHFKSKTLPQEEGFVLSVKVHQGGVEVLMSCDTRPQSSEDYYYDWEFQVQDSREIMLGKKGYRCSSGNYFFLVLSEEFSVYSLRVIEGKSNQLMLGKTTPVASELSPQEKISYELLVPLFMAEEEVLLEVYSKQSLEVDISICRFSTDCPELLPASSSFKITNYHGLDESFPIEKFSFHDEASKNGQTIKISPHKSGCYPILVQERTQDPTAVCAYLITLSNKQSSFIEFSLTSESKGPKLLRTDEPHYEIVQENNVIYYALPVTDRSSEAIQLRFTKYFGDFDVFVSNSTKYPNHQETPLQSPHEGLLVIKNLSDSEVFYIGVHAAKASSFSLSAISSVAPKYPPSNMNEGWAFALSPGKTQKGAWGGKDDYRHFYQLVLDQDDNWKGSLCITVNTSSSIWIIVNNNGHTPIIGQANYDPHWSYTEKELVITTNDTKLQKKGVYYIGLYATYAQTAADLAYEITYTLKDEKGSTHTLLSPKTPFSGDIKNGEPQYFESLLLEDESDLTIYKSGKNIKLYISTDPGDKYPDQDSFDFETKDQLTLTWSEVCKTGNCPVYITVISKGDSSYSLWMESGSAAIALKDGQETQLKTPMNASRPAVFYFQASSKQNSVITVSCPGRDVVIYAKRTKLEVESLDQVWREAPDENTAEFVSEIGTSNLTVPCLTDSNNFVISVYFKDSEGENSVQTTYKIMASSKIIEFLTDNPYSGNIKKDQYRFFKVRNSRPQTALLISLTIEDDDGSSDLFISYGENTRPTLSNHQFASISQKTHILEINNTDILPQKNMNGDWGFGVYGHSAASFILTVAWEDQKMIELKPGVPLEMTIKPYSINYFKYFHESQSHLQINFTQLVGKMDLYVSNLVDYLPGKDHFQWQISSAAQQRFFTIPMQDHKACVSCLYIIKIPQIFSTSKFSLVVNQLEDILPIQNLLLYNGQLKAQKSAIYQLTNENEEIQLNIEISEQKLIVLGSNSSSINIENYLWKESLNSNQIIPLKIQGDSYMMLHNPTEKDLDFNFTITPKLTPHERLEQIYSLDPYEKKFFEYTSISWHYSQIKAGGGMFYYEPEVDIIFYANISLENALESFLNKNQTVQAQVVLAQSNEESKKVLFQAKSAPNVRSNESHAIVEQRFSGKIEVSDKRKYLIEVFNPWEFPVEFRLDIGIPASTSTLIPQKDEQFIGWFGDYEMAMNTTGKWYFWVYSCEMGMDLKIENGDPETAMAAIPKGTGYFYKETIQNNGTRRFEVRPEKNSLEKQGKFFMFSSLIDEENFKNYDVKKDNLEVQLSYKHAEDYHSNVTVKFEPVEFTDSESSDEVIYQVRLCPQGSDLYGKDQFCKPTGCLHSEVRLSVERKEIITLEIPRAWPGNFFVKIVATIIHKNQPIKFVEPYVFRYMDIVEKKPEVEEEKKPKVIKEEKKSGFWKVLTGIMAFFLLVVVGLIVEKKVMMGSQEDREVVGSPGTVENTLKGFQPLGEEEVEEEEEDSQIERNGI